ncbi:MAG: aminoacyl-histidine dipeptidase [Clostridia bacterium]|nr:aminoacyl-histidine dipeptidase [Clostridia bacterium]
MHYIINGREPAAVFRFFEEICAIPHPSYHEERIADYLVAFAASRGLEYYRDELHNVLIKKPATQGASERAPLLLQGHTDMVCEKNGDVEHDFLKDPLKLFLEGNLLGARGTTLGGDDGIAVAVMLAILDGALAEHPALECLFTVAEEVGLNGAHGFDYSKLVARRMINLDSEDLGVVTAGCAGGLRSELTVSGSAVPFCGQALRVSVQGLMGGHSGVDIATGRANANKLMGRVLARLARQDGFRIVSLCGGSKDNAIPRECEAVVAVSDAVAAVACVREAERLIAAELVAEDAGFAVTAEQMTAPDAMLCEAELVAEDAGFAVTAEQMTAPDAMLCEADSARVLAVLATVDNGIKEMNRSIKGLVEWSRNLGVVRTQGAEVTFVFSSRSAMESRLDASIDEIDTLAAIVGGKTNHHSRYPGWEYAPVSPLRDAYLAAYRTVTGKEARVDVIHAGLECGIISSHLPDMDIISIGPDMHDIHSPAERLDLASVELFWKTLEAVIDLL